MKIVILAGGLGTRLSEETEDKPKPMVLLDDKPIVWHLMNIFANQGYEDFVIATGYKGEVIHEWVRNLDSSWNILPVDTGDITQTAGRVKLCLEYLPKQPFLVTYGDGLGNVRIKDLLDFHNSNGKLATVTAVRPPARFGVLESINGLVTHFGEKRQTDAGWINGGFIIFEHGINRYLGELSDPLETTTMPKLVDDRELAAFHHYGFWQPMDTLREKKDLAKLAELKQPPWLMGLN